MKAENRPLSPLFRLMRPALMAMKSPSDSEGKNLQNVNRLLWAVMLTGWLQSAASEPMDLPEPGPKDTCPVCGMFVAKYPQWIATARYQDGHAHHFDGAKDLFKYLLALWKWAPDHKASEIRGIGVTEYYGLTRIDARSAYYVIGSDVLGPMGHELIPLESREDAQAFLRDHRGVSILRYEDVTLKRLTGLDNGVFE